MHVSGSNVKVKHDAGYTIRNQAKGRLDLLSVGAGSPVSEGGAQRSCESNEEFLAQCQHNCARPHAARVENETLAQLTAEKSVDKRALRFGV